MSVVGALKFNINTFLNSQGFQQFKANFPSVLPVTSLNLWLKLIDCFKLALNC